MAITNSTFDSNFLKAVNEQFLIGQDTDYGTVARKEITSDELVKITFFGSREPIYFELCMGNLVES